MIANISWKATNTVAGSVTTSGMSTAAAARSRCSDRDDLGNGVAADQALEAPVLRRVTE